MTRRPRGFTLAEQLSVAGLVLLVLGLTLQVLQPALNTWMLDQARGETEQVGLVVAGRLASELRASTADSLVAGTVTGIPAVAFLSTGDTAVRFDAETGRPVWRQLVVYYLDSENRILYRKQWPAAGAGTQIPLLERKLPTTDPFRITERELRALCTTRNGTEERAAYHVEELRLAVEDHEPARLELGLACPTRLGTERTRRHAAVKMWN